METEKNERFVCTHDVQSMTRSLRTVEKRYFKTFEEAEKFYKENKPYGSIWNFWSFPSKEVVKK